MDIRRLTEQEIPLAANLAAVVYERSVAPYYDQPEMSQAFYDYINLETLQEMFASGRLFLWGAFQDNQIYAVSGMQQEGHITMLYVLPQFQRRGTGSALLNVMKDYACQECKYKRITLNAMPAWTAAFFTKRGFKESDYRQMVISAFIPMEAKLRPGVIYKKKPFPKTAALILGILLVTVSILISCGYMLWSGV